MRRIPQLLRSASLALALALPALVIADTALADGVTQGQTRLAVIDTRRAVMETEEGLRVQANLKKLFDSRQVELSEKEQKLQSDADDIAKEEKTKGASATTEAKKEQWRQKAGQLQETLMEYQRDMQRKEAELTNPMLQKMMSIVKRLAASDGYDMIVDKAAVPYFRTDLDITDKIIQLYNADGGAGVPDPNKKKPATETKKPATTPTTPTTTPPAKPVEKTK